MEDGGNHSSPTALGLGISAPCTHLKFQRFFFCGGGDWEGAQKCFILRDQTTGDLKSHHLQARVTCTALSAELWVVCYHLGNLSQLRITV